MRITFDGDINILNSSIHDAMFKVGYDRVAQHLIDTGVLTAKNDVNHCECKPEWMAHKEELNSFPYGHDYEWDLCTRCGQKHNFKVS